MGRKPKPQPKSKPKNISEHRAKEIAGLAKRLWGQFNDGQLDCGPEAFFTYDYRFDEGLPKPVFGAERFFEFCSTYIKDKTRIKVQFLLLGKTKRFNGDASCISRWLFVNSRGEIVFEDDLLSRDEDSEEAYPDPFVSHGESLDEEEDDYYHDDDDNNKKRDSARRARQAAHAEGANLFPTVVVLHYTMLNVQGNPTRELNPYLVWTWNLLHEAGHLVLHASDLLSDGRLLKPTTEPVATPAEEEEAWYFASCIIGFALGSIVYTARSRKPEHRIGGQFGAPWAHVAWHWKKPEPKKPV